MPTVTVNTARDYSELSLDERLDTCSNVQEGTELGDAITACVNAAYALNSINEPKLSIMVCVIAEQLCENVFEYGGLAAFEENGSEVIKHFTGIDYQSNKSVMKEKISVISELVKSLTEPEIIALKAVLEKY